MNFHAVVVRLTIIFAICKTILGFTCASLRVPMEAASQKFLLCHAIPSRLRVKVQDIHHEEKAAAALEHWLAAQVGVQERIIPLRPQRVGDA